MLFRGKYKFLYIIIPFLSIFLMSQNVFADSLSTASLDLYYIPVSASNYIWRNGMLYNQSQQLWQAKKFQFNTPSVIANGTNAVIHFETNIVASQPANSIGINQSHYVNLDYMTNLSCSASNGNLSIIGSSLSYARTPWFTNNNYTFNETLTLYGDIALKGFDKNTSGTITCAVGSDDYAFYNSDNYLSTSYTLYFEQNPMTIIWTDNNTDNLLQQQISQTQQLIYQNQQLYEQNNQNTQNIIDNQTDNTQDIIDNQNQNTQDIIRSNQNCHQSRNIFNKAVATQNVILNWTTGADVSNTGSITSDFIPVADGVRIRANYVGSVFFYDSSKALIGHFSANGSVITSTGGGYFDSFTVPSNLNIAYIRYSFRASTNYESSLIDKDIMVNFGETLLPYEPFGEEICKNINEQYYDEQRQADQNISNQSSSDISGAENQATTNLIGVLSNFLTQLQSFQATNCNLSLPFPQFIGGTQVVNICQGKDVLGNFITVIGTLAMVTFYIPLALVLLKMIYNEIRSFTNG